MTTDLFFIIESGRKIRWFWTLDQAQAHLSVLKEVMPSAHWMIATGRECDFMGIPA